MSLVRAVIDTSVFVRYLVKPGAAVRILIEELWVDERFVMIAAPELLTELDEVLARPRIRKLVQPEEAAVLLETIHALAEIIPALEAIPEYTRDRKDDMFVACAIAGRADYLVTTDEDILVLGELQGVRMVTPYTFVTEIAGALPA